jgi:hypothetical protein
MRGRFWPPTFVSTLGLREGDLSGVAYKVRQGLAVISQREPGITPETQRVAAG